MKLEQAEDGVPGPGWIYRFAAWLAFSIMHVQRWRFDVRGFEHVPRRGGAVIASNHTSFFDYFTVGHEGYYRYGRPVRIMARESLFRMPVFGFLMRRAEHIPVHRSSGGDALRSAVTALEEGELVLVLPEQTISRSFELLPFKTGAVRMAAQAGVPIIPAISWGTHRFHTVGRRPAWSWRLPVSVRYGEPIWPSVDDDPEAVTDLLRERMEQLLHAAQSEYADAPKNAGDRWWLPARLGGTAPGHDEILAEQAALRDAWKSGRQDLGPRDIMRMREVAQRRDSDSAA